MELSISFALVFHYVFIMTSSEPVTENELIKMLDVNPTSEIIDDQQVFIWHDRLELVVSYGQMSMYIGFNVLSSISEFFN